MNREILRLAIPNILSNISIPLLSTVDTALMGRLSEVHIGAVGMGSMIFNFVYWNLGFLRMGTTGITSQFFGNQAHLRIASTLGRALWISMIIAAAVLMLQWPLRQASIYLLNVEGALTPHVMTYYNIRIWAAPASLGIYAIMGWFFGMQNAVYPLVITVALNAVNIGLSYYFVFELGMEVEGVAWGTVIAQYFGFALGLVLLVIRYRAYLAKIRMQLVLQTEELTQFLVINRDIFIRTFLLTFAFGFFYSRSALHGDTILAVNVILLQYVNWMSYAVDGFAFATESIVGKYFGARDFTALKKAIRLNFLWALVCAILVAAIYMIAGQYLLGLFTNQPDLLQAARPYLFWMIIFPVAGFWCYIWDGVFIGLTASRAMKYCMAIALAIYLVAFLFLNTPFGNHGLWLSLIIFLAARGVVQYYWFHSSRFEVRFVDT